MRAACLGTVHASGECHALGICQIRVSQTRAACKLEACLKPVAVVHAFFDRASIMHSNVHATAPGDGSNLRYLVLTTSVPHGVQGTVNLAITPMLTWFDRHLVRGDADSLAQVAPFMCLASGCERHHCMTQDLWL